MSDMSEADQEPADALSAIVEALLAVDEINDAAARRAMVMTMPTEIRSRVIDAPSARGHTLNWVRACTKFLHGREALRSALTTHVAETALDVAAALDAIDRWWPTLVAPAKDDADPPHAGIGEWDPMALGVHRVSVPEEPGHGGPLPALTPYVRRRHDTQLTQILPPSSSTLVVLHGGPATGKTRAALEAVREVLPDWPVLRPLSTAELLDAVRRPAPQRGTVIWLDDAGDLLDAAEEVPLEMRRLLGRSGPAPVVVVATLRSDRLRQLADPGQAGTRQLQLLLKAAVHVSVPEHFTGAQRQEWRAYGHHDPRLAFAESRTGPDGKLVQTLTGAQTLLDRYDDPEGHAGWLTRAVIDSAVEARRLGHSEPLAEELLARLTDAHLTAAGHPNATPEGLTEALTSATREVHGVAPLLSQGGVGSRRYLPHGVLEQHVRARRRGTLVPPAVWEALAAHEAGVDDTLRLARAATARGLHRYAVRFASSAANRGHLPAARLLATLLERSGDPQAAGRLLRECAARDDAVGTRMLAEWYDRQGASDEAEQSWRRAAELGDPPAWRELAALLERTGRGDEIVDVWRRALPTGDPEARLRLVEHLASDPCAAAEVRSLLEAGAAAGDLLALAHLVRLVDDSGAATTGEDEGTRRLRAAARNGVRGARPLLVRRLAAAGQLASAIEECRPLVTVQHEEYGTWLARLLDEAGRGDEAERCLRDGAQAGSGPALERLVSRLDRAGRHPEADALLRTAIDRGRDGALIRLTDRWKRAGRHEEVAVLLRQAAEQDNPEAMRLLAEASPGEAERWLGRAAEAGDPQALRELVRRFDLAGRADESRDWLANLARRGDRYAVRETIRRAPTPEEAERWLRYAVEIGVPDSLDELAERLAGQGREAESDRLRRLGIDCGGATAERFDLTAS
uniref:Tetratricopeptide repeat protein n=1 Tax=Micromonospora carbonacea TaxID=47853 RepID=A0A7D6C8E1_9ACTN|nr:hypothetical protein HZU44_05800 [Micromonospora carbonacea]